MKLVRRCQRRLGMPRYEYKHVEAACSAGRIVEVTQRLQEEPLRVCPHCGGPVQRIISRVSFAAPKTNSEMRDLGFTKLVRRDSGVYENVTRRGSESRYFEADKPETAPDLKRTIRD
jgi:putative FmdB family regulatory protein